MKNDYFLVLLMIFSISLLSSKNVVPEDYWWVTDGTVETMAKEGNTIYLGGNFTIVGPNANHGAGATTQ